MSRLTPEIWKWAVIENIAIYILIVGGIIWSRTGWPLFLLVCVNNPKKEPTNEHTT